MVSGGVMVGLVVICLVSRKIGQSFVLLFASTP
jgi:hypothetical protein